jgi:hypothetical protein
MEESAFDTNQIFCDAQIFTLHARYGERMTIAQVQPLNIVAASKARAFLCEADILVRREIAFLQLWRFRDGRPTQGHSGSPL